MGTDGPGSGESEDFAALLKRWRAAAGLTQFELAEKAGLSERGISDLERGVKRRPHRDTLRMLTAALSLTPAQAAEFLAASTPAPSSAPEALPVPRTSLIGRERDAQDAAQSLRTGGTRLLTLTGPGGVGKTRLALQVAADLRPMFPDGVAFVSLAPITDPDLAPGAVVRALGIANAAGRPVGDALHAWLRARRMLLVLDNCEQAPFGPFVADLLSACPGLTVIATSRAPLHVSGEQEMPVEPLGCVDPARLPPLPDLARIAAVELFVARARAVKPDFRLTPANAAAVAEIAARLDGLPLAIELAAVRMKTLSPTALATLLAERLRILTDGPSDAPARHQTMRAAIAWSEELLGGRERAAFRRLSVFSGGCTLDDAVAVIGDGDLVTTLDDLTALVDQSLIRRDEDRRGESRFMMLETIHDFAAEQLTRHGESRFTMPGTIREVAADQLTRHGEVAEMRARHAAAYLALAERAAPLLVGPESVTWLDRLEAEHDNIRAALDWLLERHEGEQALRLTSALWRWWWLRGRLGEGRDWLTRAIGGGRDASAVALSNALNVLGNINSDLGDYADARTAYEESLALRRETGEPFPIAASLHNLGVVTGYLGDYARARSMVEEALEIKRGLPGKEPFIALSLQLLGDLAYCVEDYSHAMELLEENLGIVRNMGDGSSIAYAMYFQGRTLRWLDAGSAASMLEQSLGRFGESGDALGEAHVLPELGRLAIDRGDDTLAVAQYRRGLGLAEQLGAAHLVLIGLEGLARLATRQNALVEAARLFGAAGAGRRRLGRPLPLGELASAERLVSRARAELGDTIWDENWLFGAGQSIDDVIQASLRG